MAQDRGSHLWLGSVEPRSVDSAVVCVLMEGEHFIRVWPTEGECPIVLSAPHGGRLRPQELPDRTSGCVEHDAWSMELAIEIRKAFIQLSGCGAAPALVAMCLDRTKIDANRNMCNSGPEPVWASWARYHSAIEAALEACVDKFGFALLIDVHGQSHRSAAELGYLLQWRDLLCSDKELDARPRKSSLNSLPCRKENESSLSEVIRGSRSFGAALERCGFPCTPSPGQPRPVVPGVEHVRPNALGIGSDTYFSGGYTTRRYGAPDTIPQFSNPLPSSGWSRNVAVVQLEPEMRVREDPQLREKFAAAVRFAALHLLNLSDRRAEL